MVIIIDKNTKKVINNMGTNSSYPDGNIPGIVLQENEDLVFLHDESDEAKSILSAAPDGYTITTKTMPLTKTQLVPIETPEGEEQQYEEQQVEIGSFLTVDTVSVTKTLEQYKNEQSVNIVEKTPQEKINDILNQINLLTVQVNEIQSKLST